MARPPRPQIAGGFYHVTAKGNRGQVIFEDTHDRNRFFVRVRESVELYGWRFHSWCQMTNHYHLFFETPEPNLSEGMHRLNSLHAHWFNDAHEVKGHLFERRFGARLVVRDSHALVCLRYIALNPVRAGLCERPEQWPWSSYAATIGLAPRPDYLHVDWVLGLFSDDPEEARQLYREFVCAGLLSA
jgi:putative transposase